MTASKIEWTDRSDWNPIRGCTRVSPGCGGPGPHGGCYAEAIAARFSAPGQPFHGFAERTSKGPRWTGKVALVEDRLMLPLRWKKPARIFASSTSDIFHESLSDAEIDRIFAVMALAPQHTFQVLTKRSARMRAYLDKACGRVGDAAMALRKSPLAIAKGLGPNGLGPLPHIRPGAEWWPLPNVWLGISVEDQARADERIPDLLATPAAVRWLSCEPLLGPVDLRNLSIGLLPNSIWINALTGRQFEKLYECAVQKLDWIVAGGESGPGARPMHPDWARGLRDQCAAAGVAFHFKQWGEWAPLDSEADWNAQPEDIGVCKEFPQIGMTFARVGKKRAGRLLDGVTHNQFPRSSPSTCDGEVASRSDDGGVS